MGGLSAYIDEKTGKMIILGVSQEPELIFAYEMSDANDKENCPVVSNIKHELQGNDLIMSWTAPAAPISRYIIYRKNSETTEVFYTDEPSYVDGNLPNGRYLYSIATDCDGNCNPVRLFIPEFDIKTCSDVPDIQIDYTEECTAHISWTAPITSGSIDNLWDNTDINYSTSAILTSTRWNDGHDTKCADDFEADGHWIIQHVLFDGYSLARSQKTPDYLGISIHADNDGKNRERNIQR